jgi:serine protease AprX
MVRSRLRHCVLVAFVVVSSPVPQGHVADAKLDAALVRRAHEARSTSRVIVRTCAGCSIDVAVRSLGATFAGNLSRDNTLMAVVPDRALRALASMPEVLSVSLDRPVVGTIDRTATTTGARWVQENLGFDGSGVGVALIDSGITPSHEDLLARRVVHFADFVNFLPATYDDYGHGTHVAGIIAGKSDDTNGGPRGIAPRANLIVLKALNAGGGGYTSNVIAAVDYAIAKRDIYNIRVINLSVAAGVYESYNTDPLALAAKRAVDAGIVVVAAAGNLGLNAQGAPQPGGITSPGNAPWVLTVGACNDMGTADRNDDVVAPFSSRGPSSIDGEAKPDLVAPGVGIESIADPASALFALHGRSQDGGGGDGVGAPHLRLSGTSMAAPVVTGTIALMLQANPTLDPGAVKYILQTSAEKKSRYDQFTQGAGFLDARAAVQLAQHFSPSIAWDRDARYGVTGSSSLGVNREASDGETSPPSRAEQPDASYGGAGR